MRVTKDKPPTDAQAKRVAVLWGGSRTVSIGKVVEPTDRVLLKNSWLYPTGKGGQFPNGDDYLEYRVSDRGLLALNVYFINYAHGR